jgi:P27 family predicted phage terminase small subunit
MTIPKHLSPAAKRTWRRIAAEFELDGNAALLLETALVQWDRMTQARQMLSREGIVINGKRHPAIDVEKQASSLFLRAWRQLGLDIAPPGAVGRPAGGSL